MSMFFNGWDDGYPQYTAEERVRREADAITQDDARLAKHLRQFHVSEPIVSRVLRLNPSGTRQEGQMLRGWHYKRFESPYPWADCISKGGFLRRYGREAFAKIPANAMIKRGRRVWVRATYVKAMPR
jgi:hypothetical protein